MSRRKRWIIVGCLGAVALAAVVALGFRLRGLALVAHMRSVTRSLAEWGEEHSSIATDADASQSVKMMRYISHYYVPGPGYRGPKDVESALERQRDLALDRIAAGLTTYSGQTFGRDIGKWEDWASSGFSPTLEKALANMVAKAETIRDSRVSAKWTRYDSVFEEKTEGRVEVFYREPGLVRVDDFRKKAGGGEVRGQMVIIGMDFLLRAYPEERRGEMRRIPAEEMKAMRDGSRTSLGAWPWGFLPLDNPLTHFSNRLEDFREDFDVSLATPPKPGTVTLRIKPKEKVLTGPPGILVWLAVELVVDKATWLPTSLRMMRGAEGDDWILYEVTETRVNAGLADVFAVPEWCKIIEVETRAPTGDK